MNPKNEDDKCIQYAATVALNYNEVEYNRKRVSNVVPCIGKCNWHRINYSAKLNDSKRFEKTAQQLLSTLYMLKRKRFFKPIFQIAIQLGRNK